MVPHLRLLQLSDPHLLANPAGSLRGRRPAALLRHGLRQALAQLRAGGAEPDQLLISGDLCHDESWGGYRRLGEILRSELADPHAEPAAETMAAAILLTGNHDHPQLLRAALGRQARIGTGLWPLEPAPGWSLLALDSHCAGREGGRLDRAQWAWLEQALSTQPAEGYLLVALHHPPLAIGDPGFDAIGLEEGKRLITLLAAAPQVRGVVFGHVHQHWQGCLPGRPEVPLLGCPSTLIGYGPVQPCPLGRADDPGGRLLELAGDGEIRHRLLRWPALESP
jgi:Icc protein